MACGSCGGTPSQVVLYGFDPESEGDPPVPNDQGVYEMAGDTAGCEKYHGMFQATSVFLVGHGTEWERVFLVQDRQAAWNFAAEHKVSFAHISVLELCHDYVIKLIGS